MNWSPLRVQGSDHPAGRRARRGDERGMALVSVVFLGMLFTIMGLAVFALSGYEYGQATQRDDSGSAFWLAEAAIEHAKAEIFNDMTWDAGFDSVALSGTDEGYYSLTISDSVFDGIDAKRLFARGFVRRPGGAFVERDIEVFAQVGPAAELYALFSMDSINTNGNVGVCGLVHGNDLVDDGGSSLGVPNDSTCENEIVLSDSFEVIPPAVRTEPWYYPNTTYYYALGKKSGTDSVWIYVPDPNGNDRIRDANGIRVSKVRSIQCGNASSLVRYTGPGNSIIQWQFDDANRVNTYFNQTVGVGVFACSTSVGDETVVVNFGEYLNGAPARTAMLELGDNNSFPNAMLTTVINTRCTDTTSIATLTDTDNWTGGTFEFKQIQMIPTNGVALIVHDVDSPGNAQIEIGTDANPALFYVTGRIIQFNANGSMSGATIALGSINMNGGPDFWFNPGFIENLPDYLQIQFGASGFADVLFWREVPPLYTAL